VASVLVKPIIRGLVNSFSFIFPEIIIIFFFKNFQIISLIFRLFFAPKQGDTSDDVRGVAAECLLPLLRSEGNMKIKEQGNMKRKKQGNMKRKEEEGGEGGNWGVLVGALWEALRHCGPLSSSTFSVTRALTKTYKKKRPIY
jgi:hypothetical protein